MQTSATASATSEARWDPPSGVSMAATHANATIRRGLGRHSSTIRATVPSAVRIVVSSPPA